MPKSYKEGLCDLRLYYFMIIMLLQACGGGGAGDDGQSPTSGSDLDPSTRVSISGRITYAKVPHVEAGAGLLYFSRIPSPVRGATLQLLDASGGVLSEVETDLDGNYQVEAPANSDVRIRVLAELLDAQERWDISVTDNTDDNALYAMEGSLTSSGSADSVRDLFAPSGWGLLESAPENSVGEFIDERVAAPFAILDFIHQAIKLLESTDPNFEILPTELRWSVNNRPVPGQVEDGDIQTSHFDVGSGNIYLLGSANNDTDEYDGSVIAHEFAHMLEKNLSRSDNIGGAHSINSGLDFRIAFSEAWGNAFSSMAINDTYYRDSGGQSQAIALSIFSLEQKRSRGSGWFKEDSIHTLLYDIYDDSPEFGDDLGLGFTPLYQAFTSADLISSPAFIGIHLFVTELRKYLSESERSALNQLLENSEISVEDEFAANEQNDGGNADVLPIYDDLELGASVEVCSNNASGEWNRLGNRKLLRVTLPDVSPRTIRATAGQSIEETRINVYFRGNLLHRLRDFTPTSTAKEFTPAQAGVHIVEYYALSNVDEQDPGVSQRYCINISIN